MVYLERGRKKNMKKILIGLVVFVVLIGVVLWFAYSKLDVIVQKIVEQVGTEMTQTSVELNGVDLELLQGRAAVSELAVANPAGYSRPHAFTLDKISVDIDVDSLKGGPLVINEILVRQPKIFYEINKDQVSNLDVLKKNIESHSGSKAPPSGDQEKEKTEQGEAVKLIIKKLSFEGGKLSAASALVPDKKIEAELPAFSMSNLGQSTGGASTEQITKEILRRLLEQAAQAAAKTGVDKLKDELKEKGKKALQEKVGGALEGLLNK
jgi:uncharacterized protein involved in outer membrane biogenesis